MSETRTEMTKIGSLCAAVVWLIHRPHWRSRCYLPRITLSPYTHITQVHAWLQTLWADILKAVREISSESTDFKIDLLPLDDLKLDDNIRAESTTTQRRYNNLLTKQSELSKVLFKMVMTLWLQTISTPKDILSSQK